MNKMSLRKEEAIVPRTPYWLMKNLAKDSEKIVFLNDKNLEQFKGYKAYVQMNRQGEIHVTITGLTKQNATIFFDNLKALDPKEIVSDNK